MEHIALLTSTSPLRKTAARQGITKQRFNLEACFELAERFDVIIVASIAADEVFQYMEGHLPRDLRAKFRFYSRSFFHQFQSQDVLHASDDMRDPGWQQILSENGIKYEMLLHPRGGKGVVAGQEKFSWERLGEFITDGRVTLVSGGEGTFLYDKPPGASR
jgi:hypothetical protein